MWLVRPLPLDGESLYSILFRLSLGNDISTQDACSVLLGAKQGRDLDKLSPFCALSISEAAELTEEQAIALTCYRWNRLITPNMPATRHSLDWLPALPSRKGEVLPLAYPRCPLCLEEGTIPYARINHRLAFVTCCPKHKVFLVSKCHACGNHLTFPNEQPFLCVACGKDQRDYLETAPQAFIEAQENLLSILERGWTENEHYGAQYSFVFFRLLMWLCRMLTSKSWGKTLRQAIRSVGGPQSNVEENTLWHRGNERIYQLSPLERAKLLSTALWLWGDWPRRFIDVCRSVNLFSHTILSYGRNPPFLLLDPVREALLKPFYAFSRAEVNSAKKYLHKRGRRVTLSELQTLTGNKLHAWSNEGYAGRVCIPYGEGRYWKLDGINNQVRASVKVQAHIEGLKTAQWVERALQQALQKNCR